MLFFFNVIHLQYSCLLHINIFPANFTMYILIVVHVSTTNHNNFQGATLFEDTCSVLYNLSAVQGILYIYIYICVCVIFFLHGAIAPSGSGPPFRGFAISLTHTHTHSVGLLWTSDQPDAETFTSQHSTLTTERHPCRWQDSNPRSQQASGLRPT